jgi:hypothetical protein
MPPHDDVEYGAGCLRDRLDHIGSPCRILRWVTESARRLSSNLAGYWRSPPRAASAASSLAMKSSVASMRSTSARWRAMSAFTVSISAR